MTDAREALFLNMLEKIATEQKYENAEVETKVVPTTGSNFSSQLFYGTIKSTDKEELNVFAKVSVIGKTMREQFQTDETFNVMDVEPRFYTSLGKVYKELEEKHNIPEEQRLNMAKFYGYSSEYLKEVLVLQDMSKDGFVTYDRVVSIDWEYASTAVEELAKFHALSIAYQEEYPEKYEDEKKVFKMLLNQDVFGADMFKKAVDQMIQVTTREENKAKLETFFEKFDFNSVLKFHEPIKRPVMIHGDYRQSNLMHKIDENGKLQIMILDYQTLHTGSVTFDLLYFIFSGSDGAFREKYYDQLIEHYYESLAAALRRLGLDPEDVFPRKDFDEELKKMQLWGLIVAAWLLPVVTIDINDVTTTSDGAFESERMEDMIGMLTRIGPLYVQRVNEVVDDYVKWGVIP